MFYIPHDWLKDSTNEAAVHDILEKYLFTDLKLANVDASVSAAIEKLQEINETTVIEKIKDGTLKIN